MKFKLTAGDLTLAAIRQRLDDEAKLPPCKNAKAHTPQPKGYVEWHDWAVRMLKTHRQIKCRGCGLYEIWVKKTVRSSNRKKSAVPGGVGVPSAKDGSPKARIGRGSVRHADALLARRSDDSTD